MNLIFDFDGTICDSLDAALPFLKKHFSEFKKNNVSSNKVRKVGVKQLLIDLNFPEKKLPKLLDVFTTEIAKDIPKLNSFPGIESTIKKLSREHRLGILTSNSNENIVKFLKKK